MTIAQITLVVQVITLAALMVTLISSFWIMVVGTWRCHRHCERENARRQRLPEGDPERLLECRCL